MRFRINQPPARCKPRPARSIGLMTLMLATLMEVADIDPADAIVIRHAYVPLHGDTGFRGIHPQSTHAEIFAYTRNQGVAGFTAIPPRYWLVFIKEGSGEARLWSVLENRGEVSNDGVRREFDLIETNAMADMHGRLVIGWNAPRSWWMRAKTAGAYPVTGIADAEPIPFAGFDELILKHAELQAVMREPRYASWRTALGAVKGVYLITDTKDGRQYVGKADGADTIRGRWSAYAANGHGSNRDLRGLDPTSFRFSVLRAFDPATPETTLNFMAESHYKRALDTRAHGLNAN